MWMRMAKAAALAGALALATAGQAPAGTGTPQLTPLLLRVLAEPVPVAATDNRRHLVYEMEIANPTGGDMDLSAITIVDPATGRELGAITGDAITRRFQPGGRREPGSDRLGPSQFGVLFVHTALPYDAPVPKELVHRVAARSAALGKDLLVEGGRTAVSSRPVPVLGAPLKGGGYVAGDGCCDSVRHIRALLPLDGRYRLAQRFAIDWERIDDAGRLFTGDPKDVTSYRIYGEEALAVADGTVVAALDGLPDQVPGALPEGLPLAEADGNHVILDIGDGAYALYAHLKPGSVRVKAGDRVQRGQGLGLVGNSGNSSAPHLHLHVMDGPSALDSNGLPHVFDRFRITARDRAGTADFDKGEATGSPLTLTPAAPVQGFVNRLPLDLTVVDWR